MPHKKYYRRKLRAAPISLEQVNIDSMEPCNTYISLMLYNIIILFRQLVIDLLTHDMLYYL